jgi:hypothetical protein
MSVWFIVYIMGCVCAARYAIQDICEGRSATLAELGFIIFITIFSWIGVLALNVGWNIKNNS